MRGCCPASRCPAAAVSPPGSAHPACSGDAQQRPPRGAGRAAATHRTRRRCRRNRLQRVRRGRRRRNERRPPLPGRGRARRSRHLLHPTVGWGRRSPSEGARGCDPPCTGGGSPGEPLPRESEETKIITSVRGERGFHHPPIANLYITHGTATLCNKALFLAMVPAALVLTMPEPFDNLQLYFYQGGKNPFPSLPGPPPCGPSCCCRNRSNPLARHKQPHNSPCHTPR